MTQPKKCALCGCIEEQDRPTCYFCGEATWRTIWKPGAAPPLPEVELELVPVEPSKPKRGRR